jgi:hypothetical protein
MFVIVCKESGCVQLSCSQDPRMVMALAPDVETNFDIIEFADKTSDEYVGQFLKVINGELISLGNISNLEKEGKIEGCGDCPPYA